jgi:hypothetical protein
MIRQLLIEKPSAPIENDPDLAQSADNKSVQVVGRLPYFETLRV